MTNERSPMTLLERCTVLSAHLERVDSAERDANLVKKIREIDDAIAGHVDRAELLKCSFEILRNAEVIKPKELDLTAVNRQIQRPVETLRKRLSEKRSEITNGDTWKNLDQKAESSSKDLERNLKSAWQKYLNAKTPRFEGFRSFSAFEKCKEAIRELERLKKESDDLGRDLPSDLTALERIAEIENCMNQIIASLDLNDVPDDVRDFLRSCASGVGLSQLTDSILEWLRIRGFTDSLKVTLNR